MLLRQRLTQIGDFPRCADLMMDSFLYQHSETRTNLFRMWEDLLLSGSAMSSVIERIQNDTPPYIIGFGFAVFISDEFLQNRLLGLPPYISYWILNFWLNGDSPVLNYDEVRRENTDLNRTPSNHKSPSLSAGGLNWLGLHTGWDITGLDDSERYFLESYMFDSLFENSSGYRLKSFIKELYSVEERLVFEECGAKIISDYKSTSLTYPFTPTVFALERTNRLRDRNHAPCLVGIVSDNPSEALRIAQRFQPLFAYNPPLLGLPERDQQILQVAIHTANTEDIVKRLAERGISISPNTVNARLNAIQNRVVNTYPGALSPISANGKAKEKVRGKDRRKQLIEFLKKHPAEFRPHLTKGR